MKKIIFLFVLCIFLFNKESVHAHTAEGVGSIKVLMHAEPDDRPLINQETVLHFQIDDSSKEFNVKDCDCTITIYRDRKKLLTKPVTEVKKANSLYNATATVTFDKEGTYYIIFDSKSPGFFTELELEVGKSMMDTKNNSGIANYVTYVYLVLIVGVTVFLVYKRISS